MKINTIQISNILSFKYYENISECEKLDFGVQDNTDLHILIGPNGSGKSNFLEILNQVFKNILFRKCEFKKTNFKNRENDKNFEENKKDILTSENQTIAHLNKNWDFKDKNQQINIVLSLNENDHKNIVFVVENASIIDEYFQNYSRLTPNFSSLISEDLEAFKQEVKIETIELNFSRNNEDEQFSIILNEDNNINNFTKLYFEYFKFLEKIIEIKNIESNRYTWENLKNTFTLISCYRNYNTVNPNYQANNPDESGASKNIRNQQDQENTKQSENSEPAVFGLVKHKFSYSGVQYVKKYGERRGLNELLKHPILKSINLLLEKFLGLKLKIELPDINTWSFSFEIEKNRRTIDFQNLSAGQKGLIHLIFSLYGYDIGNGLIAIDEPELHLHPQLQKKYLEIIEEESRERDIQFIIATHSPVFVSQKTVKNIQRFYFDEDEQTSKIVIPTITETDKFLIKILNYSNAAKIFFVNKAVLVEGETDEYFFNFYFDYFKESNQDEAIQITDYEIFNIEGKGNHEEWRSFLEKWAIKVYFIGDWDNVKKMKLVDRAWKTKIVDNRTDDPTTGKTRKAYPDIIRILKSDNPAKYIGLIGKINRKRRQGIFILKKGELEDYLGIRKKLGPMISFCNSFGSGSFLGQREIDAVIKNIFKR